MTQFLNQYTMPLVESPRWERTEDGFARCKAKIMKEGILVYDRSEFVDELGNSTIPPEVTVNPIRMLVTADTLQAADSLRSLEGAHCTVGDHKWLTPENINLDSVGNVAGAPGMDGAFLSCDLLLTDPATIGRVMDKADPLGEVSAAYRADAVWQSGTWDGQPYDAKQVQLRYNHIAIIGAGEGRAGASVRILNTITKAKENDDMANEKLPVRVKLANGRYVNTDEDGAAAIESNVAEEGQSAKSVEALVEELAGKNDELAGIQAECEELKGQLETFKAKLDELLQPEAMEAAAEEMNLEQGEAGEVVENMSPEEKDEKKEEFKNSIKKLHGVNLHAAVLTHVGMKIENMSPDAIRGAFKAQVHIAQNIKTKGAKAVAGAGMFQNRKDDAAAPAQRTTLQKLGFQKTA